MKNIEFISKFKGISLAILAYLSWGLLPIYWKLMKHIPAFEILLHRMIWATLFVGLLVTIQRRWLKIKDAISYHTLAICFSAALILSVNWLVYIWAVNSGYILQCSLGYFISPLVNIVLGISFLKEKLNKIKYLALFLTLGGVAYLTANTNELPWISFILASTFGVYGLLCKKITLPSLDRFTIETLFMAPVSLVGLAYFKIMERNSFGIYELKNSFLLIGAGMITAVPLLLFGRAAQLVQLSTMGFLQYITPTLQFIMATLLYHETIDHAHKMVFLCIWSGLALISIDTWKSKDMKI